MGIFLAAYSLFLREFFFYVLKHLLIPNSNKPQNPSHHSESKSTRMFPI